MKKQINILAICFLMAGLSFVPQVAHAQLVLTPPCTLASLTGGLGYGVSGNFDGSSSEKVKEVGEIVFDGGGHFVRTYTQANAALPEFLITRGNVSQGEYTISSDCTTGTLIFHGSASNSGDENVPCVHFTVSFKPTKVSIASPIVLPPAQEILTPPPSATLLADAALSCTDLDALQLITIPIPPFARGLEGPFNTFMSTYTGTMTAN